MSARDLSFDERYRAIRSRDRRFDGQFVTAVRTTGIYCRPSCPARTPKPANVVFFPTSAAAHEAGFRACRRCLPEAAPGSPEWNLRSDAAARAMRLIADGVVEREGVPGLASRLGYSSRHLVRLLTSELGAGPLALARAHRAQTARSLLVGTELPAAEVAFASGFESVRQFNATIREVFDLSPTELRALRRGSEANAAGSLDLLLPHREPIDLAGLFAWMSARAIPGVEVAGPDSYARTLDLHGGPGWMRIRSEGGRLRLEVRLARLGDLPAVVSRARRLFDLDADPVAIDEALGGHPRLAGLVSATPGIRVPGSVDPGEMLVRAMVGQQVSVASARTALTRLTDALGESAPEHEGTHRMFPSAAMIAEHGAEVLRGPAVRVRALVSAAARLAAGDLVLTPGDDSFEQRRALLALPGVGPWTADYVRMRVTGDPDILLPGDVAVRAGAAAAGIPSGPAELAEYAERAAPWRSYLTARLWRAAASASSAPRRLPAPASPSLLDETA